MTEMVALDDVTHAAHFQHSQINVLVAVASEHRTTEGKTSSGIMMTPSEAPD
jgi:hypothetical protein